MCNINEDQWLIALSGSEAVTSGAEEKQKAPFPNRKPEGDDEGKKEGEDIDDEDDSEHDNDGNEKQPVYHWQIWSKLLKKGDQGDQLRYGLLIWYLLKNQAK